MVPTTYYIALSAILFTIGALGVVAGLILGFIFLHFRQNIVDFVQLVTGQNLWDPSIRFLTTLPSKTDPPPISSP